MAGEVIFLEGAVEYVYAEWWNDDVHKAAYSLKNTGGMVRLLAKNYILFDNVILIDETYESHAGVHLWPGVVLQGLGHGVTVLTLADDQNCDMIRTWNFAKLTLSSIWLAQDGVPYGFGVVSCRIEGNKANQTEPCNAISFYGKGYKFHDNVIYRAKNIGFYSECGSTRGSLTWADEITLEPVVVDVRESDGDGIRFLGPHDLYFSSIVAHHSLGYGIYTAIVGAPGDWLPSHAYYAGKVVTATDPENEYYYEAQNDGTSGAVEPDWPIEEDLTVVDGEVTWMCRLYSGGVAGKITASHIHTFGNKLGCRFGASLIADVAVFEDKVVLTGDTPTRIRHEIAYLDIGAGNSTPKTHCLYIDESQTRISNLLVNVRANLIGADSTVYSGVYIDADAVKIGKAYINGMRHEAVGLTINGSQCFIDQVNVDAFFAATHTKAAIRMGDTRPIKGTSLNFVATRSDRFFYLYPGGLGNKVQGYIYRAGEAELLESGSAQPSRADSDVFQIRSSINSVTRTTEYNGQTDTFPVTTAGSLAVTASVEALSLANPCVVTWTAHGIFSGDHVRFTLLTQTGWAELLNNKTFTVTKIDANTFTIPLDTSGLAAYDAGTDPGKYIKGIVARNHGLIWTPDISDVQITPASPSNTVNWVATGTVLVDNEQITVVPQVLTAAASGTGTFVLWARN